jgi:hypothetical protein
MNVVQQMEAAARATVAVHGRPGVGTGAVVAALEALGGFEVNGGELVNGGEPPDVTLRVVADAVKPEDVSAVQQAGRGPVLVALTKADTHALGPGGPVETARRHCAALAAAAGAPVLPVAGLLAVAALDPAVLDEQLITALRVLAGEPADLRTAEAFVHGTHSVCADVRRQLVQALDLFGIAHAVVTLRNDPAAGVGEVQDVLRRVSEIDGLAHRIAELAAPARYRRLREALEALEFAAITDAATAAALQSDEVVLTTMAVALDVLAAAGVADGPTGHLDRARHWQRYARGPVAALHRSCARDLTAGELVLWSRR